MVGFGPLLTGKSGTSNAGRTTGGQRGGNFQAESRHIGFGGQLLGSKAQPRRAEGKERPL